MGEKKYFTIDDNLCIANKDSKWGVLNSNLETIVSFEYEDIAGTYIKDKNKTYYKAVKEDSCGLLDIKNGEYIEKIKFASDDTAEYKDECYENLSLINEKNGKFGITDAYGNFVIPPIYDKIDIWTFWGEPFFKENNQYKDIDTESLFVLYKDGKVGIANSNVVIKEPVFDSIGKFHISSDMQTEDLDFFETIKSYNDNNRNYPYYEASMDGKYGYIDLYGNILTEFKYKNAEPPFCHKLTVAKRFDDTVDFINLESKKVIFSSSMENIIEFSMDYNHLCILTDDDNSYKIIDENGNIFASFKNTKQLMGRKLQYLNNSVLIEYPSDASSYLNLFNMNGEQITLGKNYSSVHSISGSKNILANIEYDNYSDIIDEKGNILMENLKDAFCLGWDINGFELPPVLYYINEQQEVVDKSIIPYEDEENSENDNDKNLNFVVEDESIKVVDKDGNTVKEIDFIADEYDSIDNDEEILEL